VSTATRNVGQAIAGIFRGVAKVARGIADSLDTVVDFAYVRVFGLPFIVLGYRGAGKTTLLAHLRDRIDDFDGWDPDPTAAGGDPLGAFGAPVGSDGGKMRVKPRRDVGGEYAMWETDWRDLYREARPRGIIFMIDHTQPYQHKDALNYVLQLLDEEGQRPLKVFLLLVNKSDLWAEETTLDTLLDDYRNELRRLKSQSERLGYEYMIRQTSLLTGEGVDDAMAAFFDKVRPRAQMEEVDDNPIPHNGKRG
jgi:hypothetical protein